VIALEEGAERFRIRRERGSRRGAPVSRPAPGGVMYLRFPTGTLILDWQVKGKKIHLVPRPLK